MSPVLEEALKRGGETAKELHALTEQLNDVITRAETEIRKARLGVAGRVEFRIDDEGRQHWLGFFKLENMWRLTHSVDLEKPEPLVNAQRWVRIAAVPHFERLVVQLCDNIKTEIAKIAETNADAEKLITELKQAAEAHGLTAGPLVELPPPATPSGPSITGTVRAVGVIVEKRPAPTTVPGPGRRVR